jgi:hypothetical protein
VHQFNRPDITLQGSDAPKPYYGNYVQLKCNRPDARATPSERGLVMESFQCYFGKAVAVDRPDAQSSHPDALQYFDHNFLLKYQIGTKSASLESKEKML